MFSACNCNGHAYDCYYDPEVDRHKASKSREDKYEGGGVCIDCQVGQRWKRLLQILVIVSVVTPGVQLHWQLCAPTLWYHN